MAEADHAAEAGPPHIADRRGGLQQFHDRGGAAGVRGHAQVQRAQTAVHQEAVERPGNGAHGVLDEAQSLVPLRIAGHHHPADDVGMAAEILGRRVHDEVRAQLERALVGGGGERVVDGHQRAAPAGDDAGDVDDVEQRVGGALDPDQAGVAAHRGRHGVQVGLIEEVVLQPPAAEHLVDEAIGAAVEVVGHHHVRAGLAGHRDQRMLGGQPGGERDRLAAFELAQRPLQGGPRGVGRPRVVVVADELARCGLGVGRGLVDGRDDRAVDRVGLQTGVDGPRPEPRRGRRAVAGAHVASASSRSVRVTRPSAWPWRVTSSAWVSPTSSSTASRTGSSLETAGNGGSITSAISASSSAGSEAACRSRPRSPTAPTTAEGSWAETTGSWETRCSCSSETASRTRKWGWTVTSTGNSPASLLRAQHVADGELGVALEKAVLAHPGVGEDLGQVGAPAVGQDDHDHGRGVLDLGGDEERGVQRQTAGAAGQDALGMSQPPGGQERVAVGDGHPAVDRRRVKRRRPEILADALDQVGADVLLAAGVDRPLGIGADDDEIGAALAQVAHGAGDGAAGAHAENQMGDGAGRLLPQLGPGRLVVGAGVGLVGVLVGLKRARDLGGQAVGDPVVGAGRVGRDVGRGEHDLGAVRAQQVDLLPRHLVRHHRHHPIALEAGGDGQAGAGVARRRLDDRPAGAQAPVALGRLDQGDGHAVLDRASGIEHLELGDQLRAQPGADPGQADERRVADGVQDRVRDHSG